MIRLIDSTPVPLGKLIDWAKRNGRIRGLKLHVVYDPVNDYPTVIDITDANVNDIDIGRTMAIEPGYTYVFDKGYCRYDWWAAIDDAGAFFVTRLRPKPAFTPSVGRLDQAGVTASPSSTTPRSGWSARTTKLATPMRRVRIQRDDGSKLTLLTNDFERSAVEIASLYKTRWQIELLFRWIKQHLKIRTSSAATRTPSACSSSPP